MSYSVNNIALIGALYNLNNLSNQLNISNARLTSGKRINSAADDPAGVIAAAKFDSQLATIDGKLRNAQRVSSVIDTADGAVAEISSLLESIQTNVVAAADDSVTAEERAAYQAEIDQAVQSIDRIVNTTTFNGTRLLNGGLGYQISNVEATKVADVRVTSSTATDPTEDIDLNVSYTAGTKGQVLSWFTSDPRAGDTTLKITGDKGSATLFFADGTSRQDYIDAINAVTDQTGVIADAYDPGTGTTLRFQSEEYGLVQIDNLGPTNMPFQAGNSDTGSDPTVTVGGTTASLDEQRVDFSSSGVTGSFYLTDSFFASGGSTTITVNGAGAGWKLDNSPTGQLNFGMASLASISLGNTSIGYLNTLKSGGANDLSSGNLDTADEITDYAVNLVANERARLGSLKSHAIDSTTNALQSARTSTLSARSSIVDVDYVTETANNTRLQTLINASTSIIAAMNQSHNSVLSLLTGISIFR